MKNTRELLNAVTERMFDIKGGNFKEVCPIGIIDFSNWEWAQGVGLYGLWQSYKTTKDKSILDKLINWYENNIQRGIPDRNVNTTCPMLTLAFIAEETKNEKYLDMCRDWAKWVMYDMQRTTEGGIQHDGSKCINVEQLWDDTLFMTVLFLAKAGKLFGIKEYVDEAVKQFLLHIKYLYDKKTGLFFHGWTFEGRHNFSEAFWGRGNCWYTCGVVEFLEISEIEGPVKEFLAQTLESQVCGLAKNQTESGAFTTLIDDNSSYIEMSATAGFACGILKAVRKSYIDKKYEKVGVAAVKALIDNIYEDGTVDNVSYGTNVGKTRDEYLDIPIYPMTYGQALAILALNEYLHYEA